MKFQLLPSTLDENGTASPRQHLTCFIIDDTVAVDAGSLAMAVNDLQRSQIRDIVLTHAHLDHIAGLPLFIDDLFAKLTEPIRIYATGEVIEVLERDVFNWSVYPKFSSLSNDFGSIVEYHPFKIGEKFKVGHLSFSGVSVNHKVPGSGFIISDGKSTIALSGDTAAMDGFWTVINSEEHLDAILIECAFPNELSDLAEVSHHMTPRLLERELSKLTRTDCPIFVVNIKPMYRDDVIDQLSQLGNKDLKILHVGEAYFW